MAFVQCLCYLFIDSKKIKTSKLWVLLLFILAYFILFPFLYYQKYEGARCGLPILAMYGFFWIFGGGVTIITHFAYFLLSKLLAKG